jgi:hypothetical protein
VALDLKERFHFDFNANDIIGFSRVNIFIFNIYNINYGKSLVLFPCN